MDTSKGIITLIVFFCAFVSFSFAQVESFDSLSPQPQEIDNELIELAKNSNDTILIKAILKNNPNYAIKNKLGQNALEIAYYWVNEDVFWCIYDHILAQKDTLFIQKSTMLEAAIQTGDILLTNRLLTLYGDRLNLQDRQDYIDVFAGFCISYNVKNRDYSEYENDKFPISSSTDIDLKIAEIMAHHGFDFNQPDTMGQHIIFKCRHFPVVAKYFIENKIEINKIDNKGKTFLQCFIDDISRPLYYGASDFDDYGEIDKFYSGKLELLKYYVEIGATVGKNKMNGWKYLVELLKDDANPYLKKYLFENYKDYIK